MKLSYKTTIVSCFVGYIVQAVVNNSVQLLVDMLATKFVDKIGYRMSVVTAHVTSAELLKC